MDRPRWQQGVTGAWAVLARQSPRRILLAAWLVFILGCYPGYLSVESALQLYEVRSGNYSDVHPALATLIWRACEIVVAGPFPMLAVQSGLFLFGLAGLLRRIAPRASARACAVGAAGVLLFPPVFAVMATIWPDSLMAGALVAAAAALTHPRRAWQVAGGLLLILACDCRFACGLAIAPLLVVALPSVTGARWRRGLVVAAIALGVTGAAIGVDRLLVDEDSYEPQASLLLPDTVAILRRAHVTGARALEQEFAGAPLVDVDALRAQTERGHDPASGWSLVHGKIHPFDLPADADEAWALFRAWRAAVRHHPLAYLRHRVEIGEHLLGIRGPFQPIFDDLGDFALLQPMHHRAIPSTWERGMRAVVRAAADVHLFRPWLYALGALALLVLVKHRWVRALAASGLVYELAVCIAAPTPDYRFSHWLVTATVIGAMAALLLKRSAVIDEAAVTAPPDA